MMLEGWRIFIEVRHWRYCFVKGPVTVYASDAMLLDVESQCAVWDLYLELWPDWKEDA